MNQDQPTNPFQDKMAAVIDIQQLAERCRQYAEELKTKDQTITEQQQTIDRMGDEKKRWQPIADIGQGEVQQKKNDALNRLRAIVHFTGEEHRLSGLQERFEQDDFSAEEIERFHRSITEEFQTLYPTKAHSTGNPVTEFDTQKQADWSAFRLG